MPKTGLIDRLTSQLASSGVADAKGDAIAILKARGHLDASGNLTAAGKTRQAMGASGRAKDRASKQSGRPVSDYKYNPKTNSATLKKR